MTQHKITSLYKKFSEINITFNKNIMESTGLIPGEIYLKLGTKNYPCILNSASMIGARVILEASAFFFEQLNSLNKWIALRFAFKRSDKNSIPLTFYIKSKVDSFNPLASNNKKLYFLSIVYAQKPPDDLIEILGSLLELTDNTAKRKEERIEINSDTIRLLNIKSSNSLLLLNNEKRQCILRDLSFLGIKAISIGKPEDFLNHNIQFVIPYNNPPGNVILKGTVKRAEIIKEKENFVILGIELISANIPIDYTKSLNNYFVTYKKSARKPDDANDDETVPAAVSDDQETNKQAASPAENYNMDDDDEVVEMEEL